MLYLLLKILLMPPTCNILLLLLGWLIARRWQRLGRMISVLAIASLWLIATPKGASWLIAPLESDPIAFTELHQGQAIVVLGSGNYPAAPEYDGDTLPGLRAQQRLIYAAELYQLTHLPILTSGGISPGQTQSEAQLMAQFLQQRLHTPVWKTENASRTSWENAHFSAQLLKGAGIEKIILVSQAWHLPRARFAFEQQGLTVFNAGTGYYRPRPWRFSGQYWLPEPEAFEASYWALHEWLGMIWYRIKAWQHLQSL